MDDVQDGVVHETRDELRDLERIYREQGDRRLSAAPMLSDGSGVVWTFELSGRGTGRGASHIDADGAVVST